jgi:TonB-dependent SusC/RagA subfamily outer membrane receptor
MLSPIRCSLYCIVVLLSVGLLGCSSSQSVQSDSKGADEETLNTGYGKQDKSTSTSSASTVTPSESERASANNLADLLQGQTAGVQVSSRPGGIRIQIRGINSFKSDQAPLYVVDGTPVQPSPNGSISIAPQDIESITIHKDAGSASIYGSRGANGVVVIETKGAN